MRIHVWMRRRAAVLPAVLVVACGAAPGLFARVAYNTIDPVLVVSADGRHVSVSGPISCSEIQPLDLTVTVTQRTTGAIAVGHTRTACTTGEGRWEVQAWVRGNETFLPGDARATAVALTISGHTVDDAHQWLVDVTLAAE